MAWGNLTIKAVNLAKSALQKSDPKVLQQSLKKLKTLDSLEAKIRKLSASGPRAPEARPERWLPLNPPVRYGKHKIKRYLYHFTTEENYQKMLKSGVIKLSNDGCHGVLNGVFMTDLENLTKRWRCSKDFPDSDTNIGCVLLAHAAKDTGKIVAIRVPTKYLDHNFLRIRSQNRLFRNESIPREKRRSAHEAVGCPAKYRNLYTQRKEAVEYIYGQEIPMDKVEFVGCADNISKLKSILELEDVDEFVQHKLMMDALKSIFKGQPERKCLDIIT